MKTLLPLLFSLSVARSFSTRPRFHVLPLASRGGGDHVNLTSTSSEVEPEKKGLFGSTTNKVINTVKTAPFAYSIAAFVVGYFVGYKSVAASSTATEAASVTARAARQYPIVASLLLVIAVRDAWSLVPNWVKKNLPFVRRRAEEDDPDDLTSFTAISTKLKTLFQRGQEKLSKVDDKMASPTLVFLAMLRLMGQLKQQVAAQRDGTYEKSGVEVSPKDVLQGMDEYFEFADWAYDELKDEQALKEALAEKGYTLLRHEKTALPGHADHYVAVSTERKEALIGVKGTSGFEDMLTDCCGNAVRHTFQDGPFVKGGLTEVSCHEGILLSSKRLADDLHTFVKSVLLPSGFRIKVTGHSLGAGVAVIFAMILRSRIEELRSDSNGRKLKVLAFASPPILDYHASRCCKAFVTTFVNNSDIIPRCSLSNLVLMMEFMKTVNQRLEERNLSPRDVTSFKAFAKMLAQGKDGDMIMTPAEIRTAINAALEKINIHDPDHLYVAGKVVHMYDEWTKEGYGDRSDYEDVGDDFDESKKVPTAERVYTGDGSAKALRVIEIDDRMMTDHMSPGYRASIRSLLEKANA